MLMKVIFPSYAPDKRGLLITKVDMSFLSKVLSTLTWEPKSPGQLFKLYEGRFLTVFTKKTAPTVFLYRKTKFDITLGIVS